MLHSLRARLSVLLLLLAAAAAAAGALMYGLYQQSASAQAGRAEAEVGRACDAIAAAYRFYSAGRQGPAAGSVDAALRRDLTAVVATALRDRLGVEGGIWKAGTGSLAYAFPTYQGSGPKTDVPEAELSRIEAVNRAALEADRQQSSRFDAPSQVLLLAGCPLPGQIAGLTGWTMTRVMTFAGAGYRQLMAGIAVLFAMVMAAAGFVASATITWSRHIGRIEATLQAHDVAELPMLKPTGERELDRIVNALNEAGQRLAQARQNADRLARQVATAERLAAIGRVAAGVAHEIRNPIAAMRLKAENALAGSAERKDQALALMLEQVARLDGLLRRLLSVTERDRPRIETVKLRGFLEACLAAHAELANAKGLVLRCEADDASADFDPEQMRRAVDNLILNAIDAAPTRTCIVAAAHRGAQTLVISISDQGPGPPPDIREHLFEPFVTGRAGGTGLGLSIVREAAAAHGGSARLAEAAGGTTFEIVLPCRQS